MAAKLAELAGKQKVIDHMTTEMDALKLKSEAHLEEQLKKLQETTVQLQNTNETSKQLQKKSDELKNDLEQANKKYETVFKELQDAK